MVSCSEEFNEIIYSDERTYLVKATILLPQKSFALGDLADDSYINPATGEAYSRTGYAASYYVPCVPVQDLEITWSNATTQTGNVTWDIAFYDVNKDFIEDASIEATASVTAGSKKVTKITTPISARFIRMGLQDTTLTLKTTSGNVYLDNSNIWTNGLIIEDAVSNDSTLDVGSAIINQCTITINNIDDSYTDIDFIDARTKVQVGLELDGGSIEYADKGYFKVDEAAFSGSLLTLTCLDDMTKFEAAPVLSQDDFPCTVDELSLKMCRQCGVQLERAYWSSCDVQIDTCPDLNGLTCRNIIAWCGQIAGMNARMNNKGNLEYQWYRMTDISDLDGGTFSTHDTPYSDGDIADGGSFNPWNVGFIIDMGGFDFSRRSLLYDSNYSVNTATSDISISAVKVILKDNDELEILKEYFVGSDGYTIVIENNGLITSSNANDICNFLASKLIGMTWRKASFVHTPNPCIEAGDVGILVDQKGNRRKIIISSTVFTPDANQTSTSSGSTVSGSQVSRYSESTQNYVLARNSIQPTVENLVTGIEQNTEDIDRLNTERWSTMIDTDDQDRNVFYMYQGDYFEESPWIWRLTQGTLSVSIDGGRTYIT